MLPSRPVPAARSLLKRPGPLALASACLLLGACAAQGPAPSPEAAAAGAAASEQLSLVRGYRDADDPCVLVGETAATANYLDDAADLVGCPAGTPEDQAFAAQTGAIALEIIDGYQLFTVPRR